MKIIITRQFVFGAIFVTIVLGGRLLYMCDLKASRPSVVARIHGGGNGEMNRSGQDWEPQTEWDRAKLRVMERMLNNSPEYRGLSPVEKRMVERQLREEVLKKY